MRQIYAIFANLGTVVIPALKIRQNLAYTSFQVLAKTSTYFTTFSLESRRTQASISLGCKSRVTSCVILAVGILVTSVLKEKKKLKKERWRDKYRIVNNEWSNKRKFALTFIIVFILFRGNNLKKSRFETHLRATIIKLGISSQVTVICQMRGVIQFTDVNCVNIFRIFFEVKTNTIVV